MTRRPARFYSCNTYLGRKLLTDNLLKLQRLYLPLRDTNAPYWTGNKPPELRTVMFLQLAPGVFGTMDHVTEEQLGIDDENDIIFEEFKEILQTSPDTAAIVKLASMSITELKRRGHLLSLLIAMRREKELVQ